MFLTIYVIVYLCIIIRNNAKLLYIYTIFMQDNVYLYNDMNYKGNRRVNRGVTRVDFKVGFKDSKVLSINLV